MLAIEATPAIAAGTITLIAAATDLRDFKVYNWLTLPSIALGLGYSFVAGGASGLASSLLGFLVGLAALAAFFAMGGVGAGDVKLFAALGAWLGPWHVLQVLGASALAAGAYAVALIVFQQGLLGAYLELVGLGGRMLSPGRWTPRAMPLRADVARPDRRGRLIPFAATTFLGFVTMMIVWSQSTGGPR